MTNQNAILFANLEYDIQKAIKEDIKNRKYELLPYTVGGFKIEVKNNIVKQNLVLYYLSDGDLKHIEKELEYQYVPKSEVIIGHFIESVKDIDKIIHKDKGNTLMVVRYEKFVQYKYFEEQEMIQDLLIKSYKENHTNLTWK
ncbi:MAG: hypothetical protein RR657_02755 [Peptostreptococcaceae bacterium]